MIRLFLALILLPFFAVAQKPRDGWQITSAIPPTSGWYQESALQNQYTRQCNILFDSIANAAGQCNHRLTVMCVYHGHGVVGAVSRQTPITLPITIPVYQVQSGNETSPVGTLRIERTGPTARIGLLGDVTDWRIAAGASYSGTDCGR